MTADDVVERIRKLLRLAEDAGATEAEAEAALERANALLVRHNLTMDQVAVSTGDRQPVTEQQVRTGWAGSWRGSLLAILAHHNLCSPIIRRQGKVDTVILVGRPVNVQSTHALYDWIALQLERFAAEEWLVFDRAQREAVATWRDVPWCPQCGERTEASRDRGQLCCLECTAVMLPEQPLIHGFTWKTAFYRGALLRIHTRLAEHRTGQQASSSEAPAAHGSVTALVLRTDQENADHIRQRFGAVRSGRPRRRGYHASAYQRGEERGGDLSLSPLKHVGPARPGGDSGA